MGRDNVYDLRRRLLKTAAQAARLAKLSRRERPLKISIIVTSDDDSFQEQRAWRTLFGLYQDCACVNWSKGFRKTPDVPFTGKMLPSKLPLFLREAMPFVTAGRATLYVNDERLRRRLLEVMTA